MYRLCFKVLVVGVLYMQSSKLPLNHSENMHYQSVYNEQCRRHPGFWKFDVLPD